jgi:hypothetical protein
MKVPTFIVRGDANDMTVRRALRKFIHGMSRLRRAVTHQTGCDGAKVGYGARNARW